MSLQTLRGKAIGNCVCKRRGNDWSKKQIGFSPPEDIHIFENCMFNLKVFLPTCLLACLSVHPFVPLVVSLSNLRNSVSFNRSAIRCWTFVYSISHSVKLVLSNLIPVMKKNTKLAQALIFQFTFTWPVLPQMICGIFKAQGSCKIMFVYFSVFPSISLPSHPYLCLYVRLFMIFIKINSPLLFFLFFLRKC